MSILAFALIALPSLPDVRAHFQPTYIDGGCWVDSQRPWGAGDPDRFYSFGIFDESSNGLFNACSNGCGDDGNEDTLNGTISERCGLNTGCGGWDIDDPLVSKIIPKGSGAFFYFGLWDDDFDANDSLGDHWLYTSTYVSAAGNNNNASPYYADSPIQNVCGADVEGIGDSNNFSIAYEIWFMDDDGPSFSSPPVAVDDGGPSSTDNDDTMEFTWSSAVDEDSGISQHYIAMFDMTTNVNLIYEHPVSGNSITVGLDPSADLNFPPSIGHTYRFWVGARNGSTPQLTDRFGNDARTLVWSDPVDVLMTTDLPEFYCVTSPNSANAEGSRINFGGSTSVSANDLQIIAGFAPAGQTGLFYYGPNQIQIPFGNGVRCVGGAVTRLNPPIVISAPWGEAVHSLDNTDASHLGNIQAGTSWNFQFWYRDPADGGATFNLSDAVMIPFRP